MGCLACSAPELLPPAQVPTRLPTSPAPLLCQAPQAHPFDTVAGQAALTSPFAAGAFQKAVEVEEPAAAQVTGRRGSRERRVDTHDSARTHSSSTLSGRSSLRGCLAERCARIATKSGSLPSGVGALPPPPDEERQASSGAGSGRPAAVELQPVAVPPRSRPGSTSSSALSPRAAQERDLVGALLGEAGAERRISESSVGRAGRAVGGAGDAARAGCGCRRETLQV